MTNQEIITRGELIRDETVTGANTAQRVGEAFVAIGENLEELSERNEPIVFTESKEMNSFIKTLFVDINRYEITNNTTVLDIYASWNSSTQYFYLYDSPTGGNKLLELHIGQAMKSVYCFGNKAGVFFYLEIDPEVIRNTPTIAVPPSAANPRPKLTSWATSKSGDPRNTNDGFTESPLLNKYIKKLWVEVTDDFEGDVNNVIDKLTVFYLSSTYSEGVWTQKMDVRLQVGSSQPQLFYSSESESPEIAFSNLATTYRDKVIVHAIIDWIGLRNDPISPSFFRTYLTHKAYVRDFWKTPMSDSIGDDSNVAFSQLGAKRLAEEIENIKGSGIAETISYDSDDLADGYWNLASVSIGAKVSQTTPTAVFTWYSLTPVEVKKGDVVTLYTKGGSNGRAWGLTDKDKILKAVAPAGVDYTVNPATIEVGEDGYLYVNHQAVQDTASNKNKFSLSIIRNNLSNLFADVERLKEVVDGGSGSGGSGTASIPKIYNPLVNLKKPTLRVLDIGNSFTNNAVGIYIGGSTDNLNGFIQASGISVSNMCLYRAVRSSGSFKSWYDCYNDEDTVDYSITKHLGGLSQSINGTHGVGDGSMFRSCLENNTWDIILIHQVSDYSTSDIGTLEGNGDSGYLKELVTLLRTLQPSASIGFLFTHASNRQSSQGGTASLFRQMCLSIRQVCLNYDIDFVIPVGAALENLRASNLNTTSNNFSEDNHHLAAGLGKYVAAATYFQALFAPRFDVSVCGNSYNDVEVNSDVIGTHTAYSDNYVAVTPSNAAKAQLCADLAVKFPWNISNVDEY